MAHLTKSGVTSQFARLSASVKKRTVGSVKIHYRNQSNDREILENQIG
jgi:hypothetical protein